jgi:hypothetical protein
MRNSIFWHTAHECLSWPLHPGYWRAELDWWRPNWPSGLRSKSCRAVGWTVEWLPSAAGPRLNWASAGSLQHVIAQPTIIFVLTSGTLRSRHQHYSMAEVEMVDPVVFLSLRPVDNSNSMQQLPLLGARGSELDRWLSHCTISREVACSVLDGIIAIFHWYNPSGCTMALGPTQSFREMSTRNISWGVKVAGA